MAARWRRCLVFRFAVPTDGGEVGAERANGRNRCARSVVLVGLGAVLQAGASPAWASDRTARGVIRPVAQAAISVDLAASVRSIAFREGEMFAKGDVLVAFDCRRQDAERRAAEATLRELKTVATGAAYLARHKAAGAQDVEVAAARVEKMEAEIEALGIRLEQCRIVAPFAGRVVELGINAHETPQAARPFLRIQEEGRLEVELIVPSSWLRWLSPKAAFSFTVEETARVVEGRLTRTGAAVDPVSQSIKVFGELTEVGPGVLAGMSGTAAFDQGSR